MVATFSKDRLSLKEIILVIIVIVFCLLFPQFGLLPLPFSYTIPVLVVVWFYLKRTKENFGSLGFSFKRFELKAILIGGIAAGLLFAFLNYLFFPLLSKMVALKPANLDNFKNIRHTIYWYISILAAGFVVGGLYEELIFHGFIFTRIEKMVSAPYATTASFICTNIIFGAYHLQLGIAGVINAFIAGSAYQLIMMKFNRNLWYSFFFHGFFDAIGLTYIYLGYW